MMSRVYEPTPEQEADWIEWVASRPDNVRDVAKRFDPWTLYRMEDTDQRVTVYSFEEHDDGNVTLKVDVTGFFNLVLFDRQVFGINPDDLKECDLPTASKHLGVLLDENEQREFINARRRENDLPPLI